MLKSRLLTFGLFMAVIAAPATAFALGGPSASVKGPSASAVSGPGTMPGEASSSVASPPPSSTVTEPTLSQPTTNATTPAIGTPGGAEFGTGSSNAVPVGNGVPGTGPSTGSTTSTTNPNGTPTKTTVDPSTGATVSVGSSTPSH